MSRREMLRCVAAASAAWACGVKERAKRPALPPGDLVGQSMEHGHRLRDRPRVTEPSARRWADVVVIGAGIAGLSAAWRLLAAGIENVVVLELEAVAGGTARAGDVGGMKAPWGAHYVVAPSASNRVLTRLLGDMGVLDGVSATGRSLIAEEHRCRDPEERLFAHGRWVEGLFPWAGASPIDVAEWERFEAEMRTWSLWRDGRGRPAFSVPADLGSDVAEVAALDRITMAEWLNEHRFTSTRVKWMVDYACRDDYGTTSENVSAWAGLLYFAARVQEPGEPQHIATWPEGNGRIVQHLGRPLGDRLRMGLLASRVESTDTAAVVHTLDRAGHAAIRFDAAHVVVATPQFIAARLVDGRDPTHARSFAYGPWAVANLVLKARPREAKGFPPAWDNVLYGSSSLGYVSSTHQEGVERGRTVWTWYEPLAEADVKVARRRLEEMGRDDWARRALNDLSRAHPDLPSLVERIDVMRWGHAMIRPAPGFRFGEDRRKALAPHGRVHFANTDLSGLPLCEEALWHGVRAAEEVLRARGDASSSWA